MPLIKVIILISDFYTIQLNIILELLHNICMYIVV